MSYIGSFEKYIGKVFDFRLLLSLLKDGRKNPVISIQNIFLGYFLGSMLRIAQTSRMEEEIREGVLRKRVKPMSHDTVGYGLKHLDLESVREIWYRIGKKAKRNGMMRRPEFYDMTVASLDGIETYSSFKRKSADCLTRRVRKKKGKKKVTAIQYYRKIVVLSILGRDFSMPLDLEIMRRGEDESACALRLLKRVCDKLGKRFLDIVVCDAAYCTPNFFQKCENLGVHAAAVLKENQKNLLETAEEQMKKSKPVENCNLDTAKEKTQLFDLPAVYWHTAEKDVRVVWAKRKVYKREEYELEGRRERVYCWVDKTNVVAFHKDIDLPVEILYSIGRHRWDIDAQLFMEMTKHRHLKHKSHTCEKAYPVMLAIRLITYFIFMCFYRRHINSRRRVKIKTALEMVRRIKRAANENLEPAIIFLE